MIFNNKDCEDVLNKGYIMGKLYDDIVYYLNYYYFILVKYIVKK